MSRLVIKNVGPILDVDIELKRFNVLIGVQSSGKSTIAKILSTCMWVEKEVCTTLDEHAIKDGEAFKDLVEHFHKMMGYFDESSEVHYESAYIRIDYERGLLQIDMAKDAEYHRQKICYIPAERNMVTLPELQGFEFGATNIRSFLFDWYDARRLFTADNKTSVLQLGVNYFYDDGQLTYKDRIEHVNGRTYQIPLSSASSGLQSVVPLYIMLLYYSGKYFDLFDEKLSYLSKEKSRKMRRAITDQYLLPKYHPTDAPSERSALVEMLNDDIRAGKQDALLLYREYHDVMERLTTPVRTTFVIEEPEQNLFPDTQLQLLETLALLCRQEKEHCFTVTTHSPYVVNYLNILLHQDMEGRGQIDADDLNVFAVSEGHVQNLMAKNEKGEWIVNTYDLTEQMQRIFNEYQKLRGQDHEASSDR